MPRIKCLPDRIFANAEKSQTILEVLLAADIPHIHACGGQAHCSTCRVMILDGILSCSAPTAAEKALIKKLQFPVHVRLSCQTRVTGDVTVRRMVLNDDDLSFEDAQLSGGVIAKEKNVALLMAAIRGANNFDEVNFPYDIIYIMSRYFQRTQKIIHSYGGVITNHMANAFLASFDAETTDQVMERSVWAGLEMLKSVEELNQILTQLSYRPLQLSLGIHFGNVVTVPIDPAQPNAYTILGDAVSQVIRIEAGNRSIKTMLLVSDVALRELQNKAIVGKTGQMNMNEAESINVYEVTEMLGDRPDYIAKQENATSNGIFAFMEKFGFGKKKA